ncbi:MAG: tripartite tricarboxylate transporter substrate binding protein [Pigmentiphaga sp.]
MLIIKQRKLASMLILCGATLSLPATAAASAYPDKPISIVVAYPPGSDTDVMARLYAEKLAPKVGQSIMVVNRPGASGILGSSSVARAAPDGYTLLFAPSTFATAPLVMKQQGSTHYHPINDFQPVIQMTSSSLLVVANPDTKFSHLGDLIRAAKQGEKLSYGSPGAGSPMHIVGEWLSLTAGVKLQHIPYKGVAPTVTDVVAGHIPAALVTVGPVQQYLTAGRLKALAVTDPARTPILPDVPTIAESGYPDVQLRAWNAFFAPAGTPDAVVNLLNENLRQVLTAPDVIEKLTAMSALPAGGPPDALAAQLATDYQQLGALIKQLNIQAD